MTLKKTAGCLLLPLCFLAACSSEEDRFIPDVSDITVDLSIRRFEQDFFALDTHDLTAGLAGIRTDYPEFADVFIGQVLGATDPRIAPQGEEAYLRGFLAFPPIRQLYDTCVTVYPDERKFRADFEQALRFYKYYFPARPTPSLTTFVSEYSLAAFIYGEDDLAVGLDFFLGETYPYQRYNPDNPAFSAYLTRSFNSAHLVAKTLQPLAEELVGPPAGNRLLDLMFNNGKKLYLLDLILPTTPDSVKLEMSGAQVGWLKENELEMWSFFLEEDLLYASDLRRIRKYVDPSPHSPGMPDEAPGRTANWVGWRIVKAYMKQYPDTTLDELLALSDAQSVLEKSRYKPRRR